MPFINLYSFFPFLCFFFLLFFCFQVDINLKLWCLSWCLLKWWLLDTKCWWWWVGWWWHCQRLVEVWSLGVYTMIATTASTSQGQILSSSSFFFLCSLTHITATGAQVLAVTLCPEVKCRCSRKEKKVNDNWVELGYATLLSYGRCAISLFIVFCLFVLFARLFKSLSYTCNELMNKD